MTEKFHELLDQIDKERIYQHIRILEGPRFPLDTMDKLNEAASYIRDELAKYGARVVTHGFILDGVPETFENIEAHIGDESQPAFCICSHYDSVEFCPGANDNLTAVAICLEVIRILIQLPNPPHVIANFFTLEEGHPVFWKKLRELDLKYSIVNQDFQFTKVKYIEQYRTYVQMMIHARDTGRTLHEGLQDFIKKFKDSMSKEELDYYRGIYELYKPYSTETHFGEACLIGSSLWVEKALDLGLKFSAVINYDTVGIIKNSKHTQPFPPIPRFLLRTHKTKFKDHTGNFTCVIGDKNTKKLYNDFLKVGKEESVDLPYIGFLLPMSFSKIAKVFPAALLSDHTPFWKHDIPALFLTDTAYLRWDGYHTKSDEAKYLDYEILAKICKATIAMILRT